MTNYDYVKSERVYVPFDPAYSLYRYTAAGVEDDLLGEKSASISDKIKSLYGQLYTRGKINSSLISEIDEEIVETTSKIDWYKYSSRFDTKQRTSLEKRIDLLEKTKRTELVEYWRDLFKINIYLFAVKEEYRGIKSKRDLLR